MRDNVLVQAQSQIDADRRADVERAFRHHHGGNRGHRGHEERLRYRHRRHVGRQYDPGDLYRRVERPAHDQHRARRTIRACCRCRMRRRPIPTIPSSASIFPAAWRRLQRSSTPRLAPTGLQFSNPAGTTLEVLDSGPGTIAVNSVATDDDGDVAHWRLRRAAAIHRQRYALFRRHHRGGRAEHRLCRAHHGQQRADCRSLEARQLPGGNGGRRCDAAEFHLRPARQRLAAVFSGDRHRRQRGAVYQGTLSAFMSQMVSTQSMAATTANNLQAGQDIVVNALADALQLDVGGQHRHRNGQSAHAAKHLRRECAGDDDREIRCSTALMQMM